MAVAWAVLALLGRRAGARQPETGRGRSSGPVTRGFDPPDTPFGSGHRGIDIAVALGSPVRAPAAGTVTFAGPVGGRLFLTIDHGGGLESRYSFLDALVARRGDAVSSAGRWSRRSGTGHAGDLVPNLHFAVLLLDAYVDPLDYLGPIEVWRFIRLAPLTRADTLGGRRAARMTRPCASCVPPACHPARWPLPPSRSLIVVGAPLVALADWAQFQGSGAHNGLSDGPSAPLAVAWTNEDVELEGRDSTGGLSSPVVAEDGTIVVVAPTAVLGFDGEDGSEVFSAERDLGPSSQPAIGPGPDGPIVVFTEGFGDSGPRFDDGIGHRLPVSVPERGPEDGDGGVRLARERGRPRDRRARVGVAGPARGRGADPGRGG